MAVNYLIYIVPHSPLLNKDFVPQFANFSQEDSVLLYSTLYLNHKEVLQNFKANVETHLYFDEKDKDNMPVNYSCDGILPQYFNTLESGKYFYKTLKTFPASAFPNIVMIFANSIGIKQSDLLKTMNLLNNDDNNFVIGKSIENKLAFFGFNYFDEKLFKDLSSFNITYEQLLQRINKLDYYLFTLDGFLTVENVNDFRSLYKNLSVKESIEYCNHETHEKFTHLFIEYKELL
ncbi:MAG: hypothetical protein NTX22_05480 [Ignavibacteriales bacterium]|nr:hypothetical protein [Ignavibacteriales bacterium]